MRGEKEYGINSKVFGLGDQMNKHKPGMMVDWRCMTDATQTL